MKGLNGVKVFWKEEIYFLATVIFLFCLNGLNKELISMNFGNDMELLLYDGGSPLKYFVAAIVLLLLGIYLAMGRMQEIRNQECSLVEIVASVMAVTIIAILLGAIFQLISVPILRAVLVTVGTAWLIGMANS